MSKRRSEIQLHKDNFEDSDRDEESGDDNVPKALPLADESVLKQRVFLKPKRKLLSQGNGSEGEPNKLFGGFKGFSTLAPSSTPSSLFSFASSASNNDKPLSVPAVVVPKPPSNSLFSFGSPATSTETVTKTNFPTANNVRSTDNNGTKTKDQQEYDLEDREFLGDFKKLNQVFYGHLKKFEKDVISDSDQTLYDFSNICQEYIDFANTIKKEKKSNKQPCSSAAPSNQGEKKLFSLPPTNAPTTNVSISSSSIFTPSTESKPFSFGSSSVGGSSLFGSNGSTAFGTGSTTANFGFGNGSATSTNSVFGSGTLSGFSFGTMPPAKTNGQDETTENDQEESAENDEPPKVVSVEHNEEDALYTKKCKLFYQKSNSYVDRGVGFLYIKPIKNKKQLLVRSSTSTGTILLNIALDENLPINMAEDGKGVMLTCVPNPPISTGKKDEDDGKSPLTFLIRVKKEDCQEFYETLLKHKQSA